MEQYDPERCSVFLAVREDAVLIFDPISDRIRRATYPGMTPTTTLADLFDGHVFLESPGHGWEPRDTQNSFLPSEKRCLAAKLVLGLGQSWDSGHILGSWDARKVYFLTGQDGICTRETPYTLCVAKSKQVSQDSTLTDVQSLSKLLLSIEYGYTLKLDSGQLDKRIKEAVAKDLGRFDYLSVVEDCLDFHGVVRRLSRRINGLCEDYADVARMIAGLRFAERIKNAPLPKQKHRKHHLAIPKYHGLSTPFQVDLPPDSAPVVAPNANNRYAYASSISLRPSLHK